MKCSRRKTAAILEGLGPPILSLEFAATQILRFDSLDAAHNVTVRRWEAKLVG